MAMGWSLARRAEFEAGRACAARAIRAAGYAGETFVGRSGRAPVWPRGLVGSITHTHGYCAAVVAEATEAISMGIDAEVIASVEPRLWRELFSPDEIARIEASPKPDRQVLAAVMFCAKEAFFKCQHPVTGLWLDFTDVEVWAANGRFEIIDRYRTADRRLPQCGRYRISGALALAASTWRSNPPRLQGQS